ncbi:hypothetical protein BDV06DRAFT_229184 [Aspergillus oleicola]
MDTLTLTQRAAAFFNTANTLSTSLSAAGFGEPTFEHGLPHSLRANAPDPEAKELKQQLLQMTDELRALLAEPSTHLEPLGTVIVLWRLPYSIHPIVHLGIAEAFPETGATVQELVSRLNLHESVVR